VLARTDARGLADQAFYYHYYEHPAVPPGPRDTTALITERFKLVHFYGTGEFAYRELFDYGRRIRTN
jgi:hypothetical protein